MLFWPAEILLLYNFLESDCKVPARGHRKHMHLRTAQSGTIFFFLDFPRALRHHAPIPPGKTRTAHMKSSAVRLRPSIRMCGRQKPTLEKPAIARRQRLHPKRNPTSGCVQGASRPPETLIFSRSLFAQDDLAMADELIVQPQAVLVRGRFASGARGAAEQPHAGRRLKNVR